MNSTTPSPIAASATSSFQIIANTSTAQYALVWLRNENAYAASNGAMAKISGWKSSCATHDIEKCARHTKAATDATHGWRSSRRASQYTTSGTAASASTCATFITVTPSKPIQYAGAKR